MTGKNHLIYFILLCVFVGSAYLQRQRSLHGEFNEEHQKEAPNPFCFFRKETCETKRFAPRLCGTEGSYLAKA